MTCSWALMRSSSTFRTLACAFTPTPRPWPTAWKKPPSITSPSSFSTGPIQSAAISSKVRCSTEDCIYALLSDAHSLRPHHRRTRATVQCGKSHRRRPSRHPMKNWHRNYFFDSTGINWIPPSPNLRTTKGAILYPGLEILQNAGVSVGRGTQTPFEEFGAPWLNGSDVASALNERHLPGVHFADQPFIPISGLYSGERCGGVAIRVTDRFTVRSMRIGLEIAALLQKLYPKQFDTAKLLLLVGNADTVQQLRSGVAPEKIVASWSADLAAFDQIRRKYFLYK